MPVSIEYKIREGGWKKEDNNRFGAVAVVKFLAPLINEATGEPVIDQETGLPKMKRLFEWAPTLSDCDSMSRFLGMVRVLDEKNKDIYRLSKAMEEMSHEVTKNCSYE